MYAKKGPVWCHRSTDNDFAHQALDSWDDVMPMLSTAQHFTGGIEGTSTSVPSKPSVWEEASAKCTFEELQSIWLKHACNDWHRHWWSMNAWCEDDSLSPEQKAPVEQYANGVVARCLELYHNLLSGNARPEVLAAEAALRTWW
jgi:hypothetical protein